ncbi:hypothetical protein G3I13_01815 [Streptomyces sp. SID6673]|nr:hypothetical protein [Streptomyces sp. SID11726]NDZ94897.1 hypothetical protein [Streptomyces sp. SID11726]NEB23057.1 hypothetical protein [Streptomyces sp. SID6673]
MPQGIKKINSAARFNALKKRIAKEGVTAVHNDTGYSLRTVKSINAQPDFETWRAKRDAQQAKRKHKPARPSVEPVAKAQAIQPVAPNQSVTTPDIKKPGHGRATPQRSVSHRPAPSQTDYVTREKYETDTNRLYKENRALHADKANLVAANKELRKSLRAYETIDEVEEILDTDRRRASASSWWTRMKERFGR